MIPNLTITICAYIVFRSIEAIVAQAQKATRPASGLVVIFAALFCIGVALFVTADTVTTATKTQQQMQDLQQMIPR